jgi:hypothetical protein
MINDNQQYRGHGDYYRNSGDSPPPDEEAEFWNWVENTIASENVSTNITITTRE